MIEFLLLTASEEVNPNPPPHESSGEASSSTAVTASSNQDETTNDVLLNISIFKENDGSVKIFDRERKLHDAGISINGFVEELLKKSENLKNIQVIALGGHINDKDIEALIPLFNHLQNLENLLLMDLDITDRGASLIADKLSSFRNLRKFFIRENKLLKPMGLAGILEKLPDSLEYLSVSQRIGNDHIQSLINGIQRTNRLTNLSLSNTGITDFRGFFLRCPDMPRLHSLHFGHNTIDDSGMHALANAAYKFPHLYSLRLLNMHIGHIEARVLPLILEKLPSLCQFGASDNDIDDEVAEALLPYIAWDFDLYDNRRITTAMKEHIKRAAETHKARVAAFQAAKERLRRENAMAKGGITSLPNAATSWEGGEMLRSTGTYLVNPDSLTLADISLDPPFELRTNTQKPYDPEYLKAFAAHDQFNAWLKENGLPRINIEAFEPLYSEYKAEAPEREFNSEDFHNWIDRTYPAPNPDTPPEQ